MRTCDIVLIGVGGQGVVTLGDLIARAALAADVPVSYVPTKGMAQRGGVVIVEIRLGHDKAGPRVSEAGADIVVAMERSEALKGLQYVHPDGRFILYDHVWEPTGVMLGEDDYPALDDVKKTLAVTGADVAVFNPQDRPTQHGKPVAANVFVLGTMFDRTCLRELIDPDVMVNVLMKRWPKKADENLVAFRAGLEAGNGNSPTSEFLGSSPNGGLQGGR